LTLYTVMQASGQTKAHAEQPTQESGSAIYEKLYPFELASLFSNNTFAGHATTHKLQPLHRSIFTTIAPFIFAIILFFKKLQRKCNQKYLKKRLSVLFFIVFLYRKIHFFCAIL